MPGTRTITTLHVGPKTAIGILGGGQLGRMTAMAAAKLGVRTVIFCEEMDEPALHVASDNIIAAFNDFEALRRFAQTVSVVTSEWENVPAETLAFLESLGTPVYPRSSVFATAQDRLLEKQAALRANMPTAAYSKVTDIHNLVDACAQTDFPAILKTRRGGYDGKGQRIVHNTSDVHFAWDELRNVPCILEQRLNFAYEASVIVARGQDGQVECFPATRNEHKDGILRRSTYEATRAPDLSHVMDGPTTLAEQLNVVGLLAVELFVMKNGQVIFNEMAPRPHNSGHWTIEGCNISQFDQLVRALLGLPLIAPRALYPRVVMTNLLGEEFDPARLSNHMSTPLMGKGDCYVHHYGKSEVRPGRKGGHITTVSRR